MRSITHVKPGDCFDLWHQVTCRKYSLTECSRVSDREFRARISTRDFGALTLSEIASTTPPDNLMRVTRSAGDIRRDPRDYFMLWLMVKGEVGLGQCGREARLRAGDLFMYDQTQPFVLRFGRLAHALMITIPRPFVTARTPAPHELVARPIANDSSLGALAGSLVQQLFRLDDESGDAVARRLGASALDLLLTAFEAEAKPAGAELGARQRIGQVKRYILANLHDPRLDLETIAAAQNMSTRTLNRLFVGEGITPMRWLWRQRLSASFKALAERQVTRVTDAALDFGFSDLSHFSRAFKSAFGQSPRALTGRKPGRS